MNDAMIFGKTCRISWSVAKILSLNMECVNSHSTVFKQPLGAYLARFRIQAKVLAVVDKTVEYLTISTGILIGGRYRQHRMTDRKLKRNVSAIRKLVKNRCVVIDVKDCDVNANGT